MSLWQTDVFRRCKSHMEFLVAAFISMPLMMQLLQRCRLCTEGRRQCETHRTANQGENTHTLTDLPDSIVTSMTLSRLIYFLSVRERRVRKKCKKKNPSFWRLFRFFCSSDSKENNIAAAGRISDDASEMILVTMYKAKFCWVSFIPLCQNCASLCGIHTI